MTRSQPAHAKRNGRSSLSTALFVPQAGQGMLGVSTKAIASSLKRILGLDTAVIHQSKIVKPTAPPTNTAG